jgi:hypothetical protein
LKFNRCRFEKANHLTMKIKSIIPIPVALLVSAFNLQPPTLLAQGSLTPPGAPAPTMKTLAQIEPRTPISSAPFTISAPGSYYLTTNLTINSGDGIAIATNGVTLDLNGFSISSTAASAAGYAIKLNSGIRDISIYNGHIVSGVTNDGGVYNGPGFAHGINYSGAVPVNVLVARMTVSGCLNNGIQIGNDESTLAENCMVETVGSSGVVAYTIKQCIASDCGGQAIYGMLVADCRGQSTGSGYGVLAGSLAQNCYGISVNDSAVVAAIAQNCLGQNYGNFKGVSAGNALNCYGESANNYGIYAAVAQNSYGRSSTSDGLHAYFSAVGCYGFSAGGSGLWAFNAQNCIGETASTSPAQYGVYAYDIAIGCYGKSGAGGVGLRAYIANSCDGSSLSVANKYNMP